MPINDNPPFDPTHDYHGKLYVPSEAAMTVAPYTSGGIISSAYNTDTEEIRRLRKEFAEEHEKRIQAEAREAVLKVRLENKEENKQDDEDEIDRLASDLAQQRKVVREITFHIADIATTASSMQSMEAKYRQTITNIINVLKQDTRKG